MSSKSPKNMDQPRQIDWNHFITECENHGFGLAALERETGIGRKRLAGLKHTERRQPLHDVGDHLVKFHKTQKLKFEIRYLEVTQNA